MIEPLHSVILITVRDTLRNLADLETLPKSVLPAPPKNMEHDTYGIISTVHLY